MLFVLTIVRKLARVHCCVAVIDVCALCCGPDCPLASPTPAIRTSTHGAPAPEPGASKSGGRGSGAGWLSGSPLQGLGLWCFRMAAAFILSAVLQAPPPEPPRPLPVVVAAGSRLHTHGPLIAAGDAAVLSAQGVLRLCKEERSTALPCGSSSPTSRLRSGASSASTSPSRRHKTGNTTSEKFLATAADHLKA